MTTNVLLLDLLTLTDYWIKIKHKDSINLFVTSANQHGIAYIVNLHYILKNMQDTGKNYK